MIKQCDFGVLVFSVLVFLSLFFCFGFFFSDVRKDGATRQAREVCHVPDAPNKVERTHGARG